MNDDEFKAKWRNRMQDGNTVTLFALYMTPEGPKVHMPPSADPRVVLKMLGSACEDLRESIAIARVRDDFMKAAKAAEDAQRIKVVGANGMPRIAP